MLFCWNCKTEFTEDDVRLLQRRDTCRHCGSDMHSCLNCRFWDTHANLCREGIGDYIRDREKSNFCSQFFFDRDRQLPDFDKAAAAKARLAALFKK